MKAVAHQSRELTADESSILQAYRALDPEAKDVAVKVLKAWAPEPSKPAPVLRLVGRPA